MKDRSASRHRNGRAGYSRIVAKVGTNLLTAGSDRIDAAVMATLVDQVVRLIDDGRDIVLVTSGAIAAGRERLAGVRERRDIPFRQVLAAVGQPRLMQAYDALFAAHGHVAAQTLVSKRDLHDRAGYLNARNTLLGLLELRVAPIVNENDAVAIDEIADAKIGDNDNLSALIANLIDADVLVMLTDIDGLYTADPRRDQRAVLIPRVEKITREVDASAGVSDTGRGTGGMVTKLQAAKLATGSGSDVFIADGHAPDALYRIATGEHVGTMLPARGSRIESRKRWMLSGLATKGCIVIDEGAARALLEHGRSLLPAGVREVRGPFRRGDTVNIARPEGKAIACGITNYDDRELSEIRGLRSDRIAGVLGHEYGAEAVHRNNLVLY
ncbi:MAG: glutamate 5-kinase [Dehalococcoidia bacterium]|nr:glutamate 5-kinase [Dehalococcoidia bacterium]